MEGYKDYNTAFARSLVNVKTAANQRENRGRNPWE